MTAAPRQGRQIDCRLSDVALAGIVLNLAVLVSTPLLRPDLDLFRQSLSYYALGPWGALQAAAFVALAVASLALAIALWRSGIASSWLRLAATAVAVAGVSSLALVLFPMGAPGPTTFLGDTHQSAGTIGGVAELVATLALLGAIHDDPTWHDALRPAWLAFGIALFAAVLSQIAIWWPQLGIPMGATMRLFVVPLVLLWGFVAWRLRRRCGPPLSRSDAVR